MWIVMERCEGREVEEKEHRGSRVRQMKRQVCRSDGAQGRACRV